MSDDANLAAANAKYFDKTSENQWPQWVLDLHAQITQFLSHPDGQSWLGLSRSTDDGTRRMLDYACGDGLISKCLRPLFDYTIGVDVSGNMLSRYRATAAQLGLGEDVMTGVRGDLLADDVKPTDPPLDADKLWNFDVVATSMALHHFEDPTLAVQRLAARLKAGGVLLIIDWCPLDGSTSAQLEYQQELSAAGRSLDGIATKHAASHTVSKPEGFTKQEVVELFEKAGCKDTEWKLAEKLSPIPPIDIKGQMFFARAINAA